jgi:hypothetical protein
VAGRRPGRAAVVRATGSQQHAGGVAADAAGGAGQQSGFTVRHMDQLIRAHLLLSQVRDGCSDICSFWG